MTNSNDDSPFLASLPQGDRVLLPPPIGAGTERNEAEVAGNKAGIL
jgi:hypothetical protein